MNDVSRRQWLRSAGTLGVAATIAGTASAQGRLTADDLVRTVKGARLFDLSFTWSEQSPVLSLNPPYSLHRGERESGGARRREGARRAADSDSAEDPGRQRLAAPGDRPGPLILVGGGLDGPLRNLPQKVARAKPALEHA